MQYYKLITNKTNPELLDKLYTGSIQVILEISKIAEGCNTIILEDNLYDLLIVHPSFKQVHNFNACVSPISKSFLLQGVWYVSDKEVSPLLVTLECMKNANT